MMNCPYFAWLRVLSGSFFFVVIRVIRGLVFVLNF